MERDRILGHVRREDREHVAGPEPAQGQTGCERPGHAVELRVGDRASARAVDQCRLVAVRGRVLEHEDGQRCRRDFDLGEWAPEDHRLGTLVHRRRSVLSAPDGLQQGELVDVGFGR